jgi:hypothetical protein
MLQPFCISYLRNKQVSDKLLGFGGERHLKNVAE